MAKTVLYILKPETYFKDLMALLKRNKDKQIIYVTTNKPYKYLVGMLKKTGFSPDKTFFVDCISKHIGEEPDPEPDNCIFVEGPDTLTSIGIAVNKSIEHLEGKRILLLDSLSVLLIYNDANTVAKFSNFVISKLRAADIEAAILALESDVDKDIVKQLESIVDEVRGDGGY